MIVALTSASLDITLGVAWWTLKQVFSGAIYLGTYMFSESSASKKNKILGDDPNFVPHAFPIVELEVIHSHTTINKCDSGDESIASDDDFVKISKSESILTTKDKYFKIPLTEIIHRKDRFPLWFVPFLNTYPLTNYTVVMRENDTCATRIVDTQVFSPFTLVEHLSISANALHYVYLKINEIELIITNLKNII
jgi:hypothetical protein